MATIREYHAHVYYDAPATRAQAEALVQAAGAKFGVKVGRMHDNPVGPHPRGSCQLTVRPEQFAEVIHSAHPLTSSGGLVIAIVTELDEDLARQVAALRQPGGTGLAMVLDAPSFAAQRRPEAASPEPPCVSVLRTAGWTVAVVRADDQLATVWTALAGASSPVPA